MSKTAQKIVIIGAGIGGLAAAARLAHQGFDVEVLEKGSGPGGRCGRLQVDGFTFDTGPTLLLMPAVLEETFASVGKKLSDYLTLERCDPNYRMHFRDGSDLTFSTELSQMGRELERIEPGSFGRFLEFLALGEDQYRTSLDHFVGRNFESRMEMFTPANLKHALRIKAHKTMYAQMSRFFKDDRLRAALTFQTMYLGISPYESPAVYGLLPYAELAVGIWFPRGGMLAVPRALERVATELGATFRYREEVDQVVLEGGKATGVRLRGGAVVKADLVLCNADLPWAYKNLIDPAASELKNVEKLKYTSSAFMMYLGVNKPYPQLLHHNIVFGGDYPGSFRDIFKHKRVPADPSFYVNAPAHTDPSLAPPGKDCLYVLVPVPDRTAGLDWKVEGPALREKILDRLGELGCPNLRADLEVERSFTPDDYALELNLERGAAFGLSHNFFQVGPFRPKNQDPNISNLFFVGASTQPGTGLPMVMLSAKLVAERIGALGASRRAPVGKATRSDPVAA